MEPGHILQIAATDPVAALDLPHFCNETGHIFLDARKDENTDTITYFRIKRAP
jgi:tRNA 2-thiouridine synthesizing protein A